MKPRRLRLLATIGVCTVGVLIGAGVAMEAPAIVLKLRGKAPDCPWMLLLRMSVDEIRFGLHYDRAKRTTKIVSRDAQLDVELIATSGRSFWIKRSGRDKPGDILLPYLIADHEILAQSGAEYVVRPGDIVMDCGAHVGVYTDTALRLGAAKVVAVEPDPVHVECLRRNFAPEISAGRVIVVAKGVWSSETTMTLSLGVSNSGMNTVVGHEAGGSIEVPVTTIDHLVSELGLPCISYLKMDIEGAERDALRGAMATLRRCRPRIMLDAYHRPDDMVVLPAILREAHPDYRMTCAFCEMFPGHIVPYVVFLR